MTNGLTSGGSTGGFYSANDGSFATFEQLGWGGQSFDTLFASGAVALHEVVVQTTTKEEVNAGNLFMAGFLNPPKSDLQLASAWMGYAGLHVGKYEALLRYTANNASGLSNKASALRAVKGAKILGKTLGIAGAILTTAEGFTDGNFTLGDGVKVGISLLTTFTPYGWVYGIVDLGVGLATGTSLTDRIGAGIDAMNN